METKFVDGLFVSRRENSPEYVISNLSFNDRFIDWLKNNFNARGYCNIDILKSKEGKLYAKLNDWQPQERLIRDENGKIQAEERDDLEEMTNSEINPADIPF